MPHEIQVGAINWTSIWNLYPFNVQLLRMQRMIASNYCKKLLVVVSIFKFFLEVSQSWCPVISWNEFLLITSRVNFLKLKLWMTYPLKCMPKRGCQYRKETKWKIYELSKIGKLSCIKNITLLAKDLRLISFYFYLAKEGLTSFRIW